MKHLILITSLLLSSSAWADGDPTTDNTPKVIAYQGTLERAGQPFDGDVEMTFRLYDGPTLDLEPVWSETQTVQILAGRFTALLGSVSEESVAALTLAIQAADNIHLGMALRSGDVDIELGGRQRFTPMPYAMWTTSATRFDVANDLNVGGSLGVDGDASISGALSAGSIVSAANLTAGSIVTAGDLSVRSVNASGGITATNQISVSPSGRVLLDNKNAISTESDSTWLALNQDNDFTNILFGGDFSVFMAGIEVRGPMRNTVGDISSDNGNVTAALNVAAAQDVTAGRNIVVNGNIAAAQSVTAGGNIMALGNIQASSDANIAGVITADSIETTQGLCRSLNEANCNVEIKYPTLNLTDGSAGDWGAWTICAAHSYMCGMMMKDHPGDGVVNIQFLCCKL